MRILLLFLVLLLLPIALEGSKCGPVSNLDGCKVNATFCEPLRLDDSKWQLIAECSEKLWLSDVQAEGNGSPFTEWTPIERLFCHKNSLEWRIRMRDANSAIVLEPGRKVICSKVSPREAASLTIIDGCLPGRADQMGCIPLIMDENGRILCDLTYWWSIAQLIYHPATRTTTVTTTWQNNEEISMEIESSDDGPRKLICSTRRPEQSLDKLLPRLENNLTTDMALSRPVYFCSKVEESGCGNGDCVMVPRNNSFTKMCQCHFGWRGPSCDEAYDPFGVGSSDVVRVPSLPDNAKEDSCNILLVEGCPDEATDDCIKLRYFKSHYDWGYCPRKLWLATKKEWKLITKLACINKRWIYIVKYRKEGTFYKGKGIQLPPSSRVRCSHSQPPVAPLAFRSSPSFREVLQSSLWMGANLTHLCFRNEIHCKNGGICVHHHGPASDRKLTTYCECPRGFPGELCETPTETIPQKPTCSLILVEGCPSRHQMEPSKRWELRVRETCKPLRFDEASQSIKCKDILWRSNVQAIYNEYTKTNSYTTKWTRIEKLQCVDDNWHMLYKNGSNVVGAPVLLSTKVMCSKWTPAVEADAFIEHSYSPTRAGFANGSVPSSPIAFCPEGHPNVCDAIPHYAFSDVLFADIKAVHGHCVLSYKESRFTPSCKCDFGWSGTDCRVPIDPYRIWADENIQYDGEARDEPEPNANRDTCHILDAEGCPDEGIDNCHKLRYYDKLAHCPRKLWVSAGFEWKEGVISIDGKGVNKTWDEPRWEPIDRLECTAKGWMIHRVSNGNRTREPLPLNNRVQCAAAKPTSIVSFDATSRMAFDEDVGGMVEQPRQSFCFHNFRNKLQQKCEYAGHCKLSYKGSALNWKSCVCRTHPATKEVYGGMQCLYTVAEMESHEASLHTHGCRLPSKYWTNVISNPCG